MYYDTSCPYSNYSIDSNYPSGLGYQPGANIPPGMSYQPVLQMLLNALSGETEDKMFYEYLISVAPNQKEKDIIASIRDDELKHYAMFKKIYRDLTGQEPVPPTGEPFVKPKSYIDGIERALFGELAAVEKYRRIYFALTDMTHKNMLFEIITDELRHASKYNFLYTRNFIC